MRKLLVILIALLTSCAIVRIEQNDGNESKSEKTGVKAEATINKNR